MSIRSSLIAILPALLLASSAPAEVTRSRAQATQESTTDTSGPFTTASIPGTSSASAATTYQKARAHTEGFRSRLVAKVELEGLNTASGDCLVPRPVSGEATSTARAFMFVRGVPRFRVTVDLTAALSFGGRLELAPPVGGDPTASATVRGNIDDTDTILRLTNTQDASNTEPRIAITGSGSPLSFAGTATLGFDTVGQPSFTVTGDWDGFWSDGSPETCSIATSRFVAKSVLIEITGAAAGKLGTVELALKATNAAPPESASVVDFRGSDLGARFLTDSAIGSSKPVTQSVDQASLVVAPADGPALLLLPGQNSPTAGSVDASGGSSTDVPLLQIDLSAYTQDVAVSGLTLTIDGTIDLTSELSALRLYRDTDGDGQVSDADTRLAELTSFANGQAAFENLAEQIPADSDPVNWLVTADFAGSATAARRFGRLAIFAAVLIVPVLSLVGRPARRGPVIAAALACLLLVLWLPAGCPQAMQPAREVTISVSLASDDDVSVTTDDATVVGAPVAGATQTVTLAK